MRFESLEDRRLLAVSFEFNYIGGNQVGFNDPVRGAEFRGALESAAARLGNSLLHDATVQFDITSEAFDGTAIGHAFSRLPPAPVEGGFVHTIVSEKVLGLGDANGAVSDGELEIFFFGPDDIFTYETDPAQVGADNVLDFQALVIHELAHTLGFTSATTRNGSDDFGGGITTPGFWRPYDQFISDAAGNRLIDADPDSPTAFRMDTSSTGWPLHSVGGKGPSAGLFFDGPIATAVYGSRVPLYSPATFSLASSVAHLDSEGAPNNNPVFSPTTHLMSHAIIDRAVPQEFTLVEKAIFADIGIMFVEDTLPSITAPEDLILEGNTAGGFAGSSAAFDIFLDSAVATDLFDPNVSVTVDVPDFLPLGPNTLVFTATDASGNQATDSAVVTVVDTTPPSLDVSPTLAIFEATGPDGVSDVTLPFVADASDVVDPDPTLTFEPGNAFPLGTTTVSYTAEDAFGNRAAVAVDIVVLDTTPPSFSLPATLTIPSNVSGGADLNNATLISLLDTASSDAVDPTLNFSATLPSFPLGITEVTFTAFDDSGNRKSASTLLTVTDSTFTVTTLEDELDSDPGADLNDLSLREAISLAGETLGVDAIQFDSSLNGSIQLDASLGPITIGHSVAILGPDRDTLSIDAQGQSRVIDIHAADADVLIEGVTVTGGNVTADNEPGAGIRFASTGTLHLIQSSVNNNHSSGTSSPGGGIGVSTGDLSLTDTIVSQNTTSGPFSGGGGIWTGAGHLTLTRSEVTGNRTAADSSPGGGAHSLGGEAIFSQSLIADNWTESANSGGGGLFVSGASATIRDSTVAGNETRATNSGGGGIHAASSSLKLLNSTVSGNHTLLGNSGGGGIYADDTMANFHNTTITENQSVGRGGGIGIPSIVGGTTLTIENSIVANNADDGTAPDFFGTGVISSDAVRFSLVGDNTGTTLNESQTPHPVFGNLVGDPSAGGAINPLLGALEDNGGFTPTHLPNSASPAIDSGDPLLNRGDFAPALNHDQRGEGFTRISGQRVDIGAVETTGEVTIRWENPADIVFGTFLSETQFNATADIPGSFTYSPRAGTRLDAGEAQPLFATFTPQDTENFEVTTATTFINVLKADPILTWADPESIVFNTPLSDTQLNANSNVEGTFEYSPASGTILPAGNDQVLSVTFRPTDSRNYNVVTTSVFIDVITGVPVLTWEDPADIVFGTPLGSEQLNASANVPGTFVYAPPAGIRLQAANNQTLSVTFTPDDSDNFDPITTTVMINVAKANPVITWNNPSDIIVGTPLGADQLNAEADIRGSFAYAPAAGVMLAIGDGQELTATFTPNDTGNYNTVMATTFINVAGPQDYGDAPDNYPVKLADDGARHTTGPLRLGADVDDDLGGQPSLLADGDGNDDDGVTKIADLVVVPGSETISSVSVEASLAGKLDGWIDFNHDGDWNDAGEQIITNLDVTAGQNTVSYTIPAGAVAGSTAARFRLSSAGGLAPTGSAGDGEVEDYLFTLLDGGDTPNVRVDLVNDTATIGVVSGDLIVSGDTNDLFVSPRDSLSSLQLVGSFQDQTITFDSTDAATLAPGGLAVRGGGGSNSLVLIGNGGVFDLTAPQLLVEDFDEIDLSNEDASTLTIDAAAVRSLSPSTNSAFIIAGAEDQLIVSEPSEWRMTAPIVTATRRFIRTATRISGSSEVILYHQPNAWQNFVLTGDVNNDGIVSASDALRIINELKRRDFSDFGTQALRDPITVSPWPGVYFDHSGDGNVTALDALRVINDLARQRLSEGGTVEAEPDALTVLSGRQSTDDHDDRRRGSVSPLDAGVLLSESVDASKQRMEVTASTDDEKMVEGVGAVAGETMSSPVRHVDQLLADSCFLNDLL